MDEINFKGSIKVKSSVERIDKYDYVRKWFRTIFVEGDIMEFGYFQDGLVPHQEFHTYTDKLLTKQFLDVMHDWNNSGYNIYVSPAPRKKICDDEETSGRKNVKECRWLFVDIDKGKLPWSIIPKKQLLTAIKCKVQEMNVPYPSLVTYTGHGYHLLWKLDKPTTPELWQTIEDNLVYTLQGDKKTRETCKVLRVPGFLNVKTKPFFKCKFEELHPENVYTIDQMAKHLKFAPKDWTKSKKKQASSSYSKDRPTWIEDEANYQKVISTKEPSIGANGEVFVKAADPEHEDSYRTSLNIFTGQWYDHGHELSGCENVDYRGGGIIKYLSLLKYKTHTGETIKKIITEMTERYGQRFIKWLKATSGEYKKKRCYSVVYPAKTAKKILEKYFTVPEGEPEAGMVAFFYHDGGMYYSVNHRTYTRAIGGYLNDLLWHELDQSWTKKKDDLVPFPCSQIIVDNVIKAIKGLRNLRTLVVMNGSYKSDEDIGNIFWINKRPGLMPAKDCMVCKNKIINYRTLETAELTLNMFSLSPLNVNYNEKLDPPKRCDAFLNDNFENEEQKNEVLKRDAYLCLPTYLENIPAFFVMKGKTRSGKGTNIAFLREILGRFNHKETSVYAFGEKYGLESLIGILVGFMSDSENNSAIKSSQSLAFERLKKVSSGIDEVEIRLVGGKWITVKMALKIVLATTGMIEFPSSVAEFIARMQITVYKKQYSWDKFKCPASLDPDENCLKDMIAEKDAYFTHRIIKQGLKLLLKEGFKTTEEAKQNMQDIKDESNPFEDFFQQCFKPKEGEIVAGSTVLAVCVEWMKHTKRMQKWKYDELTFQKIARGIRRSLDMETDKDHTTKITYVINQELTPFAHQLLTPGVDSSGIPTG